MCTILTKCTLCYLKGDISNDGLNHGPRMNSLTKYRHIINPEKSKNLDNSEDA
jgi:hypothetical protein